MAGGQLDALDAVGVLDLQLAAVVIVVQEQRRRKVGADAARRARQGPHRVVDMGAERHAAFVFVEQRRIDGAGQGGADEQCVALERAQHDVAQRACLLAVLGKLEIVLHLRRLVAGGDLAVTPMCRGEVVLSPLELLGRQHIGDGNQHMSYSDAFRVKRKVAPGAGTVWFSPGRVK